MNSPWPCGICHKTVAKYHNAMICITKTNELFYAGAVVVTNKLGVKIDKVATRKEPVWKRRLQNKIKELRKGLSQLEALKDKDISSSRHWERLERKYSIIVKRLNVVIEELKQD